jgi:GNAT superfamily N-acetyltransferase
MLIRSRTFGGSLLSFNIEKWKDFYKDAQIIFPRHYEELSLEKGRVPMALDFEKYQQVEDTGYLHILTMRSDGKLIGYYLALIVVHPHYKTGGLFSSCDMFYVLPEYRKGGTGAKLLVMAEESLKDRGVLKASMSVKLKQNHSELLQGLGWEPTDLVLQKVL